MLSSNEEGLLMFCFERILKRYKSEANSFIKTVLLKFYLVSFFLSFFVECAFSCLHLDSYSFIFVLFNDFKAYF